MSKHMQKKIKNKKFFKILFIISIVIFIYSTLKVAIWVTSNINMQNQIVELEKEVTVDKETDLGETTKQIDFEKIKSINSDVVGWIEIPNTNINYPIFQAKDNEYYLTRDINKNYNVAGSVFMDYENKPDFNDNNTILYGHNLRTGKMFADLQKIVRNELGNDITIYIYKSNEIKEYKVFASYITEPVKDPIYTTIENKKSFIEKALQNSKVNFNIVPNEQDKILTLSTCDNSGKNRTIVHAIEILSKITE